jgi:uncharacterized protein (DUF302 family)
MAIRQINVERFSLTSSKSFEDVVSAVDAGIGHPDIRVFLKNIAAAGTFAELEETVQQAVGHSDLMEFARFDLGEVLGKDHRSRAPRILRLVAGNPVTMKKMAEHVPDAGSYAPVTILIDERPDGVHLSYDRMASLLASYGSPDALKVARDLDSKVEALLTSAAI